VKKILVVEDEVAIREGLIDALGYHGYHVDSAETGTAAEKMVEAKRYDLVLLDLMLPEKDGFTLCREWRAAGRTLPILMLTARGEEQNRIKGLNLGADDYVTKPFSVKELLARVEAILRRTAPDSHLSGEIGFAGGKINFDRCEYIKDKKKVTLTELDLKTIRLFAINPGRALSRTELLEKIWGIVGDDLETRKVDMQIAKLRKKLLPDGTGEEVFQTVRGAGYLYAGE